MRSLSSLGIGLSLVFGCLLLALVAEIYYLLWWKKKITNRDNIEDEDNYSTSSGREFFYLFCWKKPSSMSSTALNPQALNTSMRISDTHDELESGTTHHHHLQLHSSNSSKDFLLRPYGEDNMETELMRLHNLSGPPRFLFTIKEETKEDLESEDGKSRCDKRSHKGSRGSRSLSDLIVSLETTPYLTPLSSPPFFTPPMTPLESYYSHQGFNPLFESSTDVEINRIKSSSSPPPKFKFLKDAEDKLYRRRRTLMEEEEDQKLQNDHDSIDHDHDEEEEEEEEENGSFITIFVAKNNDHHHQNHLHQTHSSSSQVLPLASSPSTIRPDNVKPMFHFSSKD